MSRTDVLRMIKRRTKVAGVALSTSCHTFRATGITAYLANGGTIENAQDIAGQESPRTTKLYDRTRDELILAGTMQSETFMGEKKQCSVTENLTAMQEKSNCHTAPYVRFLWVRLHGSGLDEIERILI